MTSRIVAVCANASAQVTTDAVTWASNAIPLAGITKGAYAESLGLFVAISSDNPGDYLRSTDGVTYTSGVIAVDKNFSDIAWAPALGLFCAISDTHGVSATSSDGVAWALHTLSGDPSAGYKCICWAEGPGLFVASGGGWCITSPDGANWTTTVAGVMPAYLYALAWSPALSLLVGVSTSGIHVMTSPTGAVWTARSAPYTSLCVVWADTLGLFIAPASSAENIMYSADGLTWSSASITPDRGMRAVVWSHGLGKLVTFCSGYNPGVVQLTSTTGTSWSASVYGFAAPGALIASTLPSIATVPNVVNAPYSAAAAAITDAALVVGVVAFESSLTVPNGAIISQSPAAGTITTPGAAVNLVESTGAVTVPDVVGLTAASAAALLGTVGLASAPSGIGHSATVPFGSVISQAPAAGSLVLAGAPVVEVISTPGSLFDVNATVISQYQNSATILRLVENMSEYLNKDIDFGNFYTFVWNVDTAQGFGLDIWGDIVGVGRLLHIVGPSGVFGFETPDIPFDWQPWGQAPFSGGGLSGQSYRLGDAAYRTLILTKALANIVATTPQALNQLVRNLFPGRGRCYVLDLGGMAMRYVFEFELTSVEFAILTQSGALPHPAGVLVSVVVVPGSDNFGFQEAGDAQPFDQGTFY